MSVNKKFSGFRKDTRNFTETSRRPTAFWQVEPIYQNMASAVGSLSGFGSGEFPEKKKVKDPQKRSPEQNSNPENNTFFALGITYIDIYIYTYIYIYISGWWFQIFFIFILTWGNDPIWLRFFKGVETTNQIYTLKHVHVDKFIRVSISKATILAEGDANGSSRSRRAPGWWIVLGSSNREWGIGGRNRPGDLDLIRNWMVRNVSVFFFSW